MIKEMLGAARTTSGISGQTPAVTAISVAEATHMVLVLSDAVLADATRIVANLCETKNTGPGVPNTPQPASSITSALGDTYDNLVRINEQLSKIEKQLFGQTN